MTAEAKWVINCIAETRGRYGLNIVLGTLLGTNRARLKELGTMNYKSYGKLRESSEAELRLLISQMILEGYIYQTEGQYSVLRMGDFSPLKDENTHIIIHLNKDNELEKVGKTNNKRSTDSLTNYGYELLEKLRALRMEISREEALPPYIIFSDKTLIDMCVKVPQNKEQMLNISGVGIAKYEKYGNRFLEEILSFKAIHPNAVISIKEDEQGKIDIKHKTEKKSKRKSDFYLDESDASNFKYTKLYYISEIKDELNHICTVKNAKKVTNAVIWEFLVSEGYTREVNKSGVFIKTQTAKGLEAGIKTIEKISPGGKTYTLLLYPDNIQKLIVEHFVQIKEFILEVEDNIEDVVYSSTPNHIHNRPERAGSAWTDEEDVRVKSEFEN